MRAHRIVSLLQPLLRLSAPPARLGAPAPRLTWRQLCGALALVTGATLQPGCGGKAVVDQPLAMGGAGGTGAGTTTTSSTGAFGGTGGTGAQGAGGTGGEPYPYQLVEIDLGPVAKDTPVPFEVSPQTLGVTTIVYSPSLFGTVGVKTVRAPNLELLVNNYKIPGHHYEFSWYGTTVTGLPQSDVATVMPVVMPGTWELTVGDPYSNDDAAKVSIWRRESADGAFHGGLLDINVFIAGGSVSESYATTMLTSAFDGHAGLNLGNLDFYSLGAQWQTIDESSFLTVLEQTAMATQAPALNVIFIGWFEGDLEQAAGIAAGIPGQGIEHGTHSSGVVMMSFGDMNVDSLIVRHESSHLAGLFHTTEIAPNKFDPLSDTPQCADVEQLLDSCPDVYNLMFPYAMYGLEVTPLQERVIQGSSLYRGELIFAGDDELGEDVDGNAAASSHQRQGRSAAHWESTEDQRAAAAPTGQWTQGLDRSVTHLLSGHWCGQDWLRGGALPYRKLLAKLGISTDQLWAIGLATDAPSQVRYRALLAAASPAASTASPQPRGGASVPIADLKRLARDRRAPRGPRLGALQALRHLSPTVARRLAGELRDDGDATISHWARR